jgi:hypothetical protein
MVSRNQITMAIECIETSAALQVKYLGETLRRLRKLDGCRLCEPSYASIGDAIRMVADTGRLHELLPPEMNQEWYLEFRQLLYDEAQLLAMGGVLPAFVGPPGFDESVISAFRLVYLHGMNLHQRIVRVATMFKRVPEHAACRATVESVLEHARQLRDCCRKRPRSGC